MKSWYRSDVLQRMVTRLPNVPVYPSRTPETKIVSCLCTIVAGATVLWTFFQTGSSVVQRKGGSEQLATSPEVVGEEIIADGVVEDAHQLQSTSPASESTDDLYTCIAGLLVSKAIEKAILLEKLREAEEKAALAERGKDEVSSSIQGAVEAAAELADEITQAVACAEARAEEYKSRWRTAEFKLKQLELQVKNYRMAADFPAMKLAT